MLILNGYGNRRFYADCFQPKGEPKGIIIFSHGFKGFKDWGAFPLIAETFAKAGFVCFTFNFSHNGTTLRQPTEYGDLLAFGNNNMSKELYDLGIVIDFAMGRFNESRDKEKQLPIYLLGHSRGGGISILKAAEDTRVSKVAVWGSVNEFGKFFGKKEMEIMQRDGVIYIPNKRTGQDMPLYKQIYEDYEANKERLYIPAKVKAMKIPLLIVHGTNDETIPFSAAEEMKSWKPDAVLVPIENGNHTFDAKHPFTENKLPADMLKAVQITADFFASAKP